MLAELEAWVRGGLIFWVHFGTPCNRWSTARTTGKLDDQIALAGMRCARATRSASSSSAWCTASDGRLKTQGTVACGSSRRWRAFCATRTSKTRCSTCAPSAPRGRSRCGSPATSLRFAICAAAALVIIVMRNCRGPSPSRPAAVGSRNGAPITPAPTRQRSAAGLRLSGRAATPAAARWQGGDTSSRASSLAGSRAHWSAPGSRPHSRPLGVWTPPSVLGSATSVGKAAASSEAAVPTSRSSPSLRSTASSRENGKRQRAAARGRANSEAQPGFLRRSRAGAGAQYNYRAAFADLDFWSRPLWHLRSILLEVVTTLFLEAKL